MTGTTGGAEADLAAFGKINRETAGGRADIGRVAQLIEAHGIETVKVGGADLEGVYRGKRMVANQFLAAVRDHGVAHCDCLFGWDIAEELIPGLRFTGWQTGFPDLVMRPDLATFALVPWEERSASVICDFAIEAGEPAFLAPRTVLQRTIARVRDLGYEPFTASELEFRIFRETPQSARTKRFDDLTPLSPGVSCYSIYRAAGDEFVLADIRRMMGAYGITIEGYNREHGQGMYEVNLRYATALTAADQTMLYKNGVKEICARHGLLGSFMAKWDHREDGTSGHFHQSLWDKDATTNLFGDANGPHGMSKPMRHYLGGLLATLPEFLVLFAPNVNSYKRFVAGTWAPTTRSWGLENRTATTRARPGSSTASPAPTRIRTSSPPRCWPAVSTASRTSSNRATRSTATPTISRSRRRTACRAP
jgi:glutamine synthetase